MPQESPDHSRNTIYDVAEYAGVAISTVSRVLNDSEDVSDATRERVLQAVRDLQYRPDRTAKSLAQRSIPTLVVAAPTLTTPFHNELLKGVRMSLRNTEVDLLVCDLSWSHPERSLQHFLRRGTVDGLLLTGMPINDKIGGELHALGVPVVLIGQRWDHLDAFYWDEVAGARMAVEHLIERGHTRIGMVTAHLASPSRDYRIQGYCEALEAAGIDVDENLIHFGRTTKHAGFSEESGFEAMRTLLAADDSITAVFAGSDVQAIGALKAIRDAGLAVPKDMAVIGYDDIKTSHFIGLTSIAQHMHRVGEEATQLLLQRVQRKAKPEMVSRQIEPRLVIREST